MLAAWLCYLLYSVTSVCTEEMRHSGKSCCHGSSTAAAAAAATAAAAVADIPKNAPAEASHRKCHSPSFQGACFGTWARRNHKSENQSGGRPSSSSQDGGRGFGEGHPSRGRPKTSNPPSVPCGYTNLNKVGLEHNHPSLYRQADQQQSYRWLQRCQEADRTSFYPHSALPHWEGQHPGPVPDHTRPVFGPEAEQGCGPASLLSTPINYPHVLLFQCPKWVPQKRSFSNCP